WWRGVDSEGGFAPLPTVVARLTACSSVPPPEQDCAGEAGARKRFMTSLGHEARAMGLLGVGGDDAEDAVEGGFGEVDVAVGVEGDAVGVAELGGDRRDAALGGHAEQAAYVESGRDEECAVAREGQARALVVTRGQPRERVQVAAAGETEELAERVEQQQRAIGARGDGDEARQRFAWRGNPAAWKERRHQVQAPRQHGALADHDAEDQRALIAGPE